MTGGLYGPAADKPEAALERPAPAYVPTRLDDGDGLTEPRPVDWIEVDPDDAEAARHWDATRWQPFG